MGVDHLHKHAERAGSWGATELPGQAPDKFHQPQEGGEMRPQGMKVVTEMPKVQQVQHFSKQALKPTTSATPHPFGGQRAGGRHVANSQVSGKTVPGPNYGRPMSGGRLG